MRFGIWISKCKYKRSVPKTKWHRKRCGRQICLVRISIAYKGHTIEIKKADNRKKINLQTIAHRSTNFNTKVCTENQNKQATKNPHPPANFLCSSIISLNGVIFCLEKRQINQRLHCKCHQWRKENNLIRFNRAIIWVRPQHILIQWCVCVCGGDYLIDSIKIIIIIIVFL